MKRQQTLRPKPNICSGYLVSYLNSPIGRREFLKPGAGSAQIVVNLTDLNKLKIPLPSDFEQHAIATTLSDADALIESLDRLIAKKRAIKQAVMQQLLTGQTRLPGFTDEWETKRLGEIADIRSGGTPSTAMPAFWNGDVPWCTPTDITELGGRKYLSGTERTISHAGLRASSAESMPSGSIIMTTRATIGECAINTVPMTTNQGFKNLIPSSCDAEFLYYLMTTKKAQLIQLCGGSTFLEIGKKSLLAFEVTLPQSHQEQQAIATVLSDMDTEIEALERRRDKARQLKQGMMQQLLTGRVRLVAPQVAA
ncbi:restriction endonuclease subunit S [Halomonas piscis]|uniref:restriction endonuclease subunit S n=1 Tax=Halomonas piscis TaxID=3031727 RepID=UPI0028A139A1|nr:restriction endonuclease subunit S [Halomonas piscis]